MRVEDYWLVQPKTCSMPGHRGHLEQVWQQTLSSEDNWIDEDLPVSKWEFLYWLTERKNMLLHGSADPDIQILEPRRPHDLSTDDFSKQAAVFAASDGIWAIFYAILDRSRPGLGFLNAAIKFELRKGQLGPTYYFFSVAQQHLESNPWRAGTVYILPKDGFFQQPPHQLKGKIVHEPHWACTRRVRPLARLRVAVEDFPFVGQVRGHDKKVIDDRAAADPDGFPWFAP